MIVALLALFVALGGTAYAALNLPANSVGTRQLQNAAVTRAKIANGAVTSGKVKDYSLLARDFRLGQLPAGPQGPQGLQGPQGPQGPAGPQGPSDLLTIYGAQAEWGEGVRGVVALAALTVGPGNYLAFGRAYVDNGLTVSQGVVCGLGTPGVAPVTEDTSQATDISRIELAPGDEQSITLLGRVSLSSTTNVTLDCYPTGVAVPPNSGAIGFNGIQVSAIEVGSLIAP